MKKVYSILVILSVWFITSCSGQNTDNSLKPNQFSAKMKATKNLTLLDVRTPGEYTEGHLKGAVNIDWESGSFESAVAGFDKTKNYFVYCRSGHRSGLAVTWMREHGFKNVFELNGGFTSWKSEEMPIE